MIAWVVNFIYLGAVLGVGGDIVCSFAIVCAFGQPFSDG